MQAIDFSNPAAMDSKVTLHFRLFFYFLFTSVKQDVIWAVFSRIAAPPPLGALRDGLMLFFTAHLQPHIGSLARLYATVGSTASHDELANVVKRHLHLARKALGNVVGAPCPSI